MTSDSGRSYAFHVSLRYQSNAAAESVRKVRFEFYDAKKPPASTLLVFEGLPSLDALLGMEVVTKAGQT